MQNNIYKKLLIPGLLGALLMGSGDWLLAYVDSTQVAGTSGLLFWIGFTKDFALWRPIAAMVTGGLGAICYLPALWGMRLTIKPLKAAKIFGF